MSTPPPPPALSPAASFHGPALAGIVVATMMYGMCVLQALSYYERFPKDPLWMKAYVGILMLTETLNSGFTIAWIYGVLITNWGNILALAELNWLLATEPAMIGIMACLAQNFFAWRIKSLTESWYIPIAILLLSITALVGGLVFSAAFATYPFAASLATERSARVLASIWLVPPTIADALITVTLSLHLRKSRSGIKRTETIINSIIRTTVQNGMLTTVIAVVDLACFLAMPASGIHVGFNFPLGKAYTNSVLSSLNARSRLRNMNGENQWSRSDHGQISSSQQQHQRATESKSRTVPEVYVAVEMQRRGDPATGEPDSSTDNLDSKTQGL
ncbi:hypothetical protein CYLTODRAFT_485576 [Cylindrobasidium torrendii FP15055 ss-10]|uniref:DUF6534 domain-containing protein n=1 Tax=Cylindrobasidium torrendii FP15055 ss-10 TaxID=1314674 RepID=A0A0D7BSP2_9AGAR|nr:hypothetical protein CYLTODRAFT_485576 [Cylindrobasidium torrendii FP15055 ss-10]